MNSQIRNLAIVAHVDHGKTTLVDALLRETGVFRRGQAVVTQVLDSGELERERGITIMAKNTAIRDGDLVINIVDTPGHQDFGGEVERSLNMVDGVLLLVDAFDGPMPQTRFVLEKALAQDKAVIVVINKIDREDARAARVLDLVYDLFIELGATDRQIEFPVLYASARQGAIFRELPEAGSFATVAASASMRPLLDTIRQHIPAPVGDPEEAFRLLVANVEYDPYIGHLAVGRIASGRLKSGQEVVLLGASSTRTARVSGLFTFFGLERRPVDLASAGEIVCLSGLPDVHIGETVADPELREPLPFLQIDEPTVQVLFSVNDGRLAADEATYLTSRHLAGRLQREEEKDVSLSVETTDRPDVFRVKGRGGLHLAILIETMRREGYAFTVSRPEVIYKETADGLLEPQEEVVVDLPEAYVGAVIAGLGRRRGELQTLLPAEKGLVRLVFSVPSRGLIGYSQAFLTDTRGHGILSAVLKGYVPFKGAIEARSGGVLVASEEGRATAYGLYQSQARGELLIGPGEAVYQGMIVGRTAQQEDVIVNVCRKKQVTNIRAAGSDEALRLVPPLELSLEQALELLADDELLDITPKNFRLRKKILDPTLRLREKSRVRREQA